MKRQMILLVLLLVALPLLATASGIKRVEISPSALMNLGSGHSGAFMGGALTGDLFFSETFAFRTTIGFSKDRFFPSELDYADADYRFWLSMAPYVQLNVGTVWRPYVSFLGSFGMGSANAPNSLPGVPAFDLDRSPLSQIQPASSRDSQYSLGGSLGSKLLISGNVWLFAEISHIFYSNVSDRGTFYNTGQIYLDQSLNVDKNPTYVSFGLTYAIDLSK